MILTEKILLKIFTKNNCKKQTKKKGLELKKLSREKVISFMLNRKDTLIRLIAG